MPQGRSMLAATLGHYKIVKPLGSGGMGEVYLARDTRLGREVALKLLPAQIAGDEQRLQRLRREARATAALNHPNIVTLYAFEEEGESPFLAMELVEGETLAARIPPTGLPVGGLLTIGTALADALHAAHGKGIIHRDLKPANIMLTWDDRLKVLDFGLSRLDEEVHPSAETLPLEDLATRPGAVLGTAGYMAPEQVRGESADERSDIFALGGVLYQATTGRAPFGGASASERALAVLRDEPAPPVSFRTDLPGELNRLILRCLAKDPDRRIQTALDVRNELEDVSRHLRKEESGPQHRSVAVLPFADMSPERDQAYLCEGLAEELITALTRLEGLNVTPRTSAFRFGDSELDLRDIGRQLGVDTLLQGSVRKAGEQLRVSVQLLDMTSSSHLWSERFDRTFDDIFAVQDEIAERTAERLRGMLTEEERATLKERTDVDPKAYELYLRGQHMLHRLGKTHLAAARGVFRRALELEPEFAHAWVGLSLAHSWEYQWWRREGHREPGLQAAQKALALRPELAAAHVAMGWAKTHGEDLEEAEGHLHQALELDADLWEAHWFYARHCVVTQRPEEASRHFGRAAELDVEDYQSIALQTMVLAGLGKEEQMLRTARRGVERVRQKIERYPEDARAHYLGAGMLLHLGERERALEWAERAEELEPGDPATLYNLACFHALAGERERALEELERCVQTGFGFAHWIDQDPDLDSLREDPRFEAIRAQLD